MAYLRKFDDQLGSWNICLKEVMVSTSPEAQNQTKELAISIVDDYSFRRNDRSREINVDTNSKPFNLGTTRSLFSSNACAQFQLVRFGICRGRDDSKMRRFGWTKAERLRGDIKCSLFQFRDTFVSSSSFLFYLLHLFGFQTEIFAPS